MTAVKNAIVAIALLMATAFPAFADQSVPTKASMVNAILEVNGKLARNEAVRIVNAVFVNAQRYSLDPFLLFGLINQESRFRTTARSNYGAVGLMQVVPRFHRDKLSGRSPTNIETNVEVGSWILADCLDAAKGRINPALKCYSGGARNYTALLKAGHTLARKADILYRFENELPVTVISRFEDPRGFATSTSASPVTYASTPSTPATTSGWLFVESRRIY